MKAKTLVGRRVIEALAAEGEMEKPASRAMRAALENALKDRPTLWIERNEAVDPSDLGEVESRELENVVELATSDVRAELRKGRWQRDHKGQRGPAWTSGYSPPWWDDEIERLFGTLRHLQDEALSLVYGEDGEPREHLHPHEMKKVLGGIAEWELAPGERVTLDVPTGFYNHSNLLSIKTLTFVGQEDHDGEHREKTNILHRLQELIDQVEYAAGCRSWEALGFLLCNEVPWVPALQVEAGRPPGSIKILIRQPEIALDVVTDAIKNARRELGVERGRPPDMRTGWPAAVYGFVEEWRKANPGRLRWPPIYKAFGERHPDAPYVRGKGEGEGLDSLRETFYQERRRREGTRK